VKKSLKGAAGLAQQVRNTKSYSVQKSPKGAAGQAQQVCNTKSYSMQKSPKGAAGQAQQVCQSKSFTKRTLRAKVAKGAAGLANKCAIRSLLLKGHSVQKSPKGAAGLAQQVHDTKSLTQRRPTGHITIQVAVTYTLRRVTRPTAQINTTTPSITARTTQGHHILHRFNLRDDDCLPIIEQHYFQFLTLKKIPQIPLTNARSNRRRQ
jgi:hypothetical protein